MEPLKFEIIKTETNYTYLYLIYLINDKQLYTVHSNSDNGIIFKCKNRKKCKCRVKLINNQCKRMNNQTHHESNGGEKEYTELKNTKIMKEVVRNFSRTNIQISELCKMNNIECTQKLYHNLYRYRKQFLKSENIKTSTEVSQDINTTSQTFSENSDSEWQISNENARNMNLQNQNGNSNNINLQSTSEILQDALEHLNSSYDYNSTNTSTDHIKEKKIQLTQQKHMEKRQQNTIPTFNSTIKFLNMKN